MQRLCLKPGDVTDVSDVRPWNGWCAIDYCKLCGDGPMATSFEFGYTVNGQPGDKRIYVSEGCHRCTRELVDHDPFYQSRDQWVVCVRAGKNTYDVYRTYGLIDDFHIDETDWLNNK